MNAEATHPPAFFSRHAGAIGTERTDTKESGMLGAFLDLKDTKDNKEEREAPLQKLHDGARIDDDLVRHPPLRYAALHALEGERGLSIPRALSRSPLLDNSEWMRNGDYIPSRLEAQHDAANLLCGTKTQSNPESTVGVLTMAGKSVSIGGEMKLSNAIQVAQLALKHRRNKTGGQRVVVFIGSPITEDEKTLTKIGKLLKKNNIAVDVISMGEVDANAAKLQVFVDAANSNNNSHLVTVPAGVLPSDVLVSSPVLHGDDSPMVTGGGASAGGDNFAEYGGIDPSMDPELALVRVDIAILASCALRVSMEEERARQEAAQKKAAEEAKQQEEAAAAAPAAEAAPAPASPKKTEEASKAEPKQEEAAVASAPSVGIPPPAPAPASSLPFMDPTFVNSLLSGLPGVDPNDPKIQAAMAQMNSKKDDSKDEEKKDDK
ncbi:26s proteasome non-atpase regulatory subunit, partial [Globisporangium splendens]